MPKRHQEEKFKCCGEHITQQELEIKLDQRDKTSPLFRLEKKCFHNIFLNNGDFSRVSLSDSCFFDANLIHGNFKGAQCKKVDFRKARLNRSDFSNAELVGVNFTGADLEDVDFSNSNLMHAKLQSANLDGAKFFNTRITSDSFGRMINAEKAHEYFLANDIYLSLKRNFEEHGDHDSASWAYYRDRVCIYKSHGPLSAFHYHGEMLEEADENQKHSKLSLVFKKLAFWFTKKSWLHWLIGLLQDGLWGFAQKPLRVLIWGCIVVLFFAYIYWHFQLICLSNGVCMENRANITWSQYLLYSLAAFSTSSPSNLTGVNTVTDILASIQGILGVSVLALFTTSLASRLGGA